MGTDRRIKYTKMVLRESLVRLLNEKPISRISIKELCDHADVNRSTFYTHFTDQFDLLKKIETDFIADINSYLDNFALEAGETHLLQMISKILEYVVENKELCCVLLGENGNIDFQTNIMKVIRDRIVLEWKKRQKVDESTAEYIYVYAATGSIGVIRKWLVDENPRSPQEMARLIARLANKGTETFIK